MHGQDLDVYLPVVPAATCAKSMPSIIRGENRTKKRADARLAIFRRALTTGSSGTKKTFTKLSRNRLSLNHQPAVPASTIIPMHGQDLDVNLPVVPAATIAVEPSQDSDVNLPAGAGSNDHPDAWPAPRREPASSADSDDHTEHTQDRDVYPPAVPTATITPEHTQERDVYLPAVPTATITPEHGQNSDEHTQDRDVYLPVVPAATITPSMARTATCTCQQCRQRRSHRAHPGPRRVPASSADSDDHTEHGQERDVNLPAVPTATITPSMARTATCTCQQCRQRRSPPHQSATGKPRQNPHNTPAVRSAPNRTDKNVPIFNPKTVLLVNTRFSDRRNILFLLGFGIMVSGFESQLPHSALLPTSLWLGASQDAGPRIAQQEARRETNAALDLPQKIAILVGPVTPDLFRLGAKAVRGPIV